MPDPAPPTGYNKSIAAVAAGALSTLLIYITDGILKANGIDALPPAIESAVQTLVTTAAVFLTPHGSSS